MDFGDILNEWERIKRDRQEKRPELDPAAPPPREGPKGAGTVALEDWLARNEVCDKDAERGSGSALKGEERARRDAEFRRLAAMKCQAVLDLHGMGAEEARSAIRSFIADAARSGLEKVLVIHGKGLHSDGAPVLKRAAREEIEANPLAGRFGEAAKAEGGSGALWVCIRSKR